MKVKTKLHYAKIDEVGDIPCFKLDFDELIGFVLAEASYDVVHLISINGNVFVSHSISQISNFINIYFEQNIHEIFWQEYESYEESYKVALSMQETTPFCYKINK